MAFKTAWFLSHGVTLLADLPEGTYFENDVAGKPHLSFQARTIAALRRITTAFPGTIWQKTWKKDLGWWEYTTLYRGTAVLRIYAVKEAPSSQARVSEQSEPMECADCGHLEVNHFCTGIFSKYTDVCDKFVPGDSVRTWTDTV